MNAVFGLLSPSPSPPPEATSLAFWVRVEGRQRVLAHRLLILFIQLGILVFDDLPMRS